MSLKDRKKLNCWIENRHSTGSSPRVSKSQSIVTFKLGVLEDQRNHHLGDPNPQDVSLQEREYHLSFVETLQSRLLACAGTISVVRFEEGSVEELAEGS